MDTVGFIPAAGKGKRMKPFLLIKELLPVKIVDREENQEEVCLLFENSFQTFLKSNINNVVCTISKEKDDLRNYIIKYKQENEALQIAFVYQDTLDGTYGIPYAIKAASPFLKGKTVIMRFPDTIITPDYCLQDVLELHKSKASDLTLGVFPTKNPERLAPVIIGEDGNVLKIEDKTANPSANNTWNCVIWEDAFLYEVLDYIKEMEEKNKEELILSDIMNRCLQKGMRVYAKLIDNGECQDYSAINDFIKTWEHNKMLEDNK